MIQKRIAEKEMNEIDDILRRADETLLKMQSIERLQPAAEDTTMSSKARLQKNFSKLSLNQSKVVLSPPRSKSTMRNVPAGSGAYS